MIADTWNEFIASQNPDIFATFTFGNDFFRRKEGGRMRTIERASREGAAKQCVKSFLYWVSRVTKQHVRMIYGCEDILSSVESNSAKSHYPEKRTQDKRVHLHGLIIFETSMYRIHHYAEDKYGSSGVEDALSQLWAKHLAVDYCSWVKESPEQFKIFSKESNGAGSYSCLKHSEGELVMDICPTYRNICKKGKGDCAFHWENKEYE
jgi:hypothetical protein